LWRVGLVDAGAAHFHGGGDFAVVVVQLFGQQVEFADLRDLRQPRIALGDHSVDELAHAFVLDQRAEMRERNALGFGPFAHGFVVDLNEGADKLAPVGHHDAFLDVRAALHGVFDLGRREVFAAGGDHDVFEAVDDLQLAVDLAHHVARVQPAALHGLGGGFRVFVITGKHHVTLDLEFTCYGVDTVRHALGGNAHAAHLHVVQLVAGDHAGGFGQAIHLNQWHAQYAEKTHHIGRDGGRTGQ